MNEIEKSILGALFSPETADEVLQHVAPSEITNEAHRVIFEVLDGILTEGKDALMTEVLTRCKLAGANVQPSYILELIESAPATFQVKQTIELFKTESKRRAIVNLGRELVKMKDSPLPELAHKVETFLNDGPPKVEIHKVGELLRGVVDDMEEAARRNGKICGLPTSIGPLDTMLSGLCDGDYVILAARPSIGKTALALNICEHVAIDQGLPVVFFTLEMSAKALAKRLSFSRARIDMGRARNGMLADYEFSKLSQAMEEIKKAPLYIASAHGQTMAQIRSRARVAKRKVGAKLVVVDYLGLIQGEGSEYERVTNNSLMAKPLALELGCPLLMLHQLNRGNEKRSDTRPIMSDLRSSGQIEQDADVIMFLHRKKENAEEEAEIIVEKQRNGPTGIVEAMWNGPHNRYKER